MALATSYRIADRIYQGESVLDPMGGGGKRPAGFAASLPDYTRVDITGVGRDRRYQVDGSMRVKLPYPDMWIEYEEPQFVQDRDNVVRSAVIAKQVDDVTVEMASFSQMRDSAQIVLMSSMVLGLTDDGFYLGMKASDALNRVMQATSKSQAEFSANLTKIAGEEYAQVLLSLSLMNCRNVDVIDGRKVAARYSRKKRRIEYPRLEFKTIKLPGGYSTGGGPGAGEAGDLAFHLVRGHFATYSEDKPRFGIPGQHGTFWIGPHARGQKKHGIVQKDYEVA